MTAHELVATMTTSTQTWVVPASEGRHYRRGWLRARWTAWRWNYRSRRQLSGAAHVPPLIWIVRRPVEYEDVNGCVWCVRPAAGTATRIDAHGFHRVPSCGTPGHGEGYAEDEVAS